MEDVLWIQDKHVVLVSDIGPDTKKSKHIMEEKVVKENQTLMNIVISHALPLIANGLIGQHLPVLKLVAQEYKPIPDTKMLKHNMEERNVLEIPL